MNVLFGFWERTAAFDSMWGYRHFEHDSESEQRYLLIFELFTLDLHCASFISVEGKGQLLHMNGTCL